MAQSNQWDQPLNVELHETAEHAPILTPVEARQGLISGRVRLVLAVSLTLVIVAFALIYTVQI